MEHAQETRDYSPVTPCLIASTTGTVIDLLQPTHLLFIDLHCVCVNLWLIRDWALDARFRILLWPLQRSFRYWLWFPFCPSRLPGLVLHTFQCSTFESFPRTCFPLWLSLRKGYVVWVCWCVPGNNNWLYEWKMWHWEYIQRVVFLCVGVSGWGCIGHRMLWLECYKRELVTG